MLKILLIVLVDIIMLIGSVVTAIGSVVTAIGIGEELKEHENYGNGWGGLK